MIDPVPSQENCYQTILKASYVDTILGSMIAVSYDERLYLLEFIDRQGLEKKIKKLKLQKKSTITHGLTSPIIMIKQEIDLYFTGKLKKFKTPLILTGSDFQKKAWNMLIQISYGQTRSYLQQALSVGNVFAVRAVANANSVNSLTIVIPCHRIINSNGNLGGYGGGKGRKKWLINHEKQYE